MTEREFVLQTVFTEKIDSIRYFFSGIFCCSALNTFVWLLLNNIAGNNIIEKKQFGNNVVKKCGPE